MYFLKNIQETFKFKRLHPDQWKIPSAVLMSEMWTDELAKEKTKDYLNEKECAILTQEQIDVIDKHINKSILEDLNYSVQKPISIKG